jgi:predicted ester cyclase
MIRRPASAGRRFFGLTLYRLEDGKVRAYWRADDRHDLHDRQLGGWRPG